MGDNGVSLKGGMASKGKVVVVSGFFSIPQVKLPKYVEIARKNHEDYCQKNGYEYKFFSDYDESLPSRDETAFYRGCNSKPWHIRRVMEECTETSIVMWIDIDSLFMSYMRMDGLIEQDESLVIAGDCSDFANSGHIIVRNDKVGKEIIELWRALINSNFTTEKRKLCRFSLTSDGYIQGDQTALVAALGGAKAEEDVIEAFNMLNLYSGNIDRRLRHKETANALTDRGLEMGQEIVDRTWNGKVRLKKQRAMNSYVVGPLGGLYRRGDWSIHFVGNTRVVMSTDSLWRICHRTPGGRRLSSRVWLYIGKRKIKEVISRFRKR